MSPGSVTVNSATLSAGYRSCGRSRYLQAVGNFKIEGVICAAEGEGRSCSLSLLVPMKLPVLLAVNRKGARYSRRCSTLAPVLRVVV